LKAEMSCELGTPGPPNETEFPSAGNTPEKSTMAAFNFDLHRPTKNSEASC
jgi:hypothetical protein